MNLPVTLWPEDAQPAHDPDRITLTPAELQWAAIVGALREAECLAKSWDTGPGPDPADGWRRHVEGVAGEIAVARRLNRYPAGFGGYRKGAPDLGGNIEVRTCRHAHGCLILEDTDPVERRYVAVFGLNGVYRLAGWITGHVGKAREKTHRGKTQHAPGFWIPQSELWPIAELVLALALEARADAGL